MYMRLAREAADSGRGCSQLAASMRIHICERQLKRYESGEVMPKEHILRLMEQAYGIDGLVDYFYNEQEKEEAA
jgi:ribosome-binding protein aMBF1 (putative translation factor)